MLSSLRTIVLSLWIVNLSPVFGSDAIQTSRSTPTLWVPGALVFCKKLKGQKQEEKRRLNRRVEKMSNSFAIILNPPTNPEGSPEGDRVNIEWLGDGSNTVKIGVKSKYLRPVPHLYIHSFVDYDSGLLKRYKLHSELLTKLILKDHSEDSIRLRHFVDDLEHVVVRRMSGCKFKGRVTASDMSLLHMIEAWYDGELNSSLDMHVAVGTKVDARALNKENLMRLCTMVYQQNLKKRTLCGFWESADITPVRHVLQRQVHFVIHSQKEMDQNKMACIGPALCGFFRINLAITSFVACILNVYGLNAAWALFFLSPVLIEVFLQVPL